MTNSTLNLSLLSSHHKLNPYFAATIEPEEYTFFELYQKTFHIKIT
jgi:hypothetical protein